MEETGETRLGVIAGSRFPAPNPRVQEVGVEPKPWKPGEEQQRSNSPIITAKVDAA